MAHLGPRSISRTDGPLGALDQCRGTGCPGVMFHEPGGWPTWGLGAARGLRAGRARVGGVHEPDGWPTWGLGGGGLQEP
eukprot:4013655-Pyramimonas_sp.AAC.1